MKRTLHPGFAVPISVGIAALMLGAVHFSGNIQNRSQIIFHVLIATGIGGGHWMTYGDAIQKQRQREDDESPKLTPPALDLADATIQTVATPVAPSPAPTPQPTHAYVGTSQEDDLWDDDEPAIGFRFNVDGV